MNYLQLKIKKTNSITIFLMLKSTFVEIPKPLIKLSIIPIILPKQSTKINRNNSIDLNISIRTIDG
jgi:hypothetical protein